MSQEQETLWNVSDVAKYLKIDPNTVYEYVKVGNIPYTNIGKGKRAVLRFQKAAIDAWLQNNTTSSDQE